MLDIDDIVAESQHACRTCKLSNSGRYNRLDFLHTLIGNLCITGFVLVFILLVLVITSNDAGYYKPAVVAITITTTIGLTYIFMPH